METYSTLGPILLDIEGASLTAEDKEILRHPHVGGVIFFSRNYHDPHQLTELVKEIRQLRPQLLLTVDQEGGRVQRFKDGLTTLPALGILGASLDQGYDLAYLIKLAEHLGFLMALEVRALGVDLSFAPVLDLNRGISEVIGNRALHRDPYNVTSLARAYIKGMHRAGMQAVGKHFPGHAAVAPDSHFALPEDLRPLTEVKEDIIPFEELITLNLLAGIMPAHIVYPAVDSLPVGFSEQWLEHILRQQFAFAGAIISDDLSMEGAKQIGNYAKRAQQALAAGCNFILICNNRAGAIEAIEKINDQPNNLSLQRRTLLHGRGAPPSLSSLKELETWKEAFTGVQELCGLMDARISVS